MSDNVTTTIRELRQVDAATNTNKFYRTYAVTGLQRDSGEMFDVVAFHWGRIGSKGQWKVETLPAGRAASVAREKRATKQRNGYLEHQAGGAMLSIVPEEIQARMGESKSYSTSLDLGKMLADAQTMTVDLMEGRATAKDVAMLGERARQAEALHQDLTGRLAALQALVVAGVGA